MVAIFKKQNERVILSCDLNCCVTQKKNCFLFFCFNPFYWVLKIDDVKKEDKNSFFKVKTIFIINNQNNTQSL